MHPNSLTFAQQHRRVQRHARNSDAYSFFNLLTGPELIEQVESLLPPHRERRFPPTETLSMFLAQALSADRSCQKAVNDTVVKRLAGGLPRCSTHTGAYCRARACRWRWCAHWRATRGNGSQRVRRSRGVGEADRCGWWTARRCCCQTRRPIRRSIRNRAASSRVWGSRCVGWWAWCVWAVGRCSMRRWAPFRARAVMSARCCVLSSIPWSVETCCWGMAISPPTSCSAPWSLAASMRCLNKTLPANSPPTFVGVNAWGRAIT